MKRLYQRNLRVFLLVVILLNSFYVVQCDRIYAKRGEPVHFLTKCNNGEVLYEAPRSQSPKYAMDNSIWLPLMEVCGKKPRSSKDRLELVFSHGILSVPRFEVGSVNQLDVTFYHAEGSIHSVSVQRNQNSLTPNEMTRSEHSIKINFIWEEEAKRNVKGGIMAMKFCSFIIIIFTLIRIFIGMNINNDGFADDARQYPVDYAKYK